jgi:hypothetical protein
VFAVVLFLCFQGKLLAGGVFPDMALFSPLFHLPYGPFDWKTFKVPEAAESFGKLMVWSFIAGFAERFVPDTIDRLIERGRAVTAPSNVASQPAPPYAPSANPAPKIESLSPPRRVAGGPAFTLTVSGTNFLKDSIVRWNGAPRGTRFMSVTQVSADITASDIVQPGTASVTVSNPGVGAGAQLSDEAIFTVLPLPIGGPGSPPGSPPANSPNSPGGPEAVVSPFR